MPAPADAPKRHDTAASPNAQVQGETRNPAFRAADQAAIQQVNEQLRLAQQEQLQAMTRNGNTVPEGMVLIPAGEFLMGADDGLPDTRPMHRVYVSTYWVDHHEVTNRQYRQCMESGGCGPPKDHSAYDDSALADHPITNVTWTQARNYCGWRGRRLPTEAEWEMAASAEPTPGGQGSTGHKRRYPWGDEPPTSEHANLDTRFLGCVDVAAFPAGDSAFGCRQMAGNIWEWTASAFYPFPGYLVDEPYREYSAPWFGYRKVLKGGAWATRARLAYNTYRNFFPPARHDVYAGFRTCAR